MRIEFLGGLFVFIVAVGISGCESTPPTQAGKALARPSPIGSTQSSFRVTGPATNLALKAQAPKSASSPVAPSAVTPGTAAKPAPAVAAAIPSAAPLQVSRRECFRFKDRTSADGFVRMAAKKQEITSDTRTLSRLVEEKQKEREWIAQTLADKFGITASANYEFDPKTLTIYEVQSSTNAAPGKTKHRELKDKADGNDFIRLVTARRLIDAQIDAMRLLIREKEIEMERTEQALADQYSIVKTRNYQYDADTLTLYESVVIPVGAEAPDANPVFSIKAQKK